MLTQALQIREGRFSIFQEVVICFCASILIALFAHVQIPLPFSPVPISMQPHVVLFLSVLLGARRCVFATLAYLGQGFFGLPVFAGAVGGAAILAGPTGGYLLGYIVAAYVTGLIIEKLKARTIWNAFFAMLIGSFVIYFFGVLKLATYVGAQKAILLGVLPFLVGDFIKIGINLKALQLVKWFDK